MPSAFVAAPRTRVGAPTVRGAADDRQARPQAANAGLRHPALQPLIAQLADAGIDDLAEVTDIFVNGAAGVFVDRGRGVERAGGPAGGSVGGDDDVRALAVALIGAGGRHIDDASPCVDVRLEGGVRVHAMLSPIAADGTAISVRIPRVGVPDLDSLEARGMFASVGAARLRELVVGRANILVTGAAGAGKTTLLAALLSQSPSHERIVTIEDVAELRFAHAHHVRLEARQPNLEGAGGVDLARLVREALRMRPDRLVVGECRGAEIRELLSALNTGHDGGAGTLHANGLHDVPARLEALGALGGLDERALARQAVSALDIVLHVARDASGVRRLVSIGRPVLDGAGRLGIEEDPWPED